MEGFLGRNQGFSWGSEGTQVPQWGLGGIQYLSLGTTVPHIFAVIIDPLLQEMREVRGEKSTYNTESEKCGW